jgi:hypothetical protein
MVEKIFNALKQEFSYLGLGDSVLRPYAESLGACGFVTDDNLNDVVSKQKSSLEAIQKANDKRAADAMKTAEEKAEAKRKAAEEAEAKKAEEAAKKAEEEKAKKAAEEKAVENKEDTPEWFKAYQTAQEEKFKEALEKNKALEDSLKSLQDENAKFKTEQDAAKRNSFIASEAKRLGVPEWRSKEGFSISTDMDEKAITEYLSQVANNVKANMLPEEKMGFPKFDGKATKEEVDKIADNLLK